MKMLRNNILVKKLEKERLGAIVLPESIKDDWYRGEVIAVGSGMFLPDGTRVEPETKAGDIVVFPPPQYTENYPSVVVNGIECIILNEANIWAIEE